MSHVTESAAHPAAASRGIGIRRFFTTEGIHPYDELEWDLRDSVIQNWRTGEIAFE